MSKKRVLETLRDFNKWAERVERKTVKEKAERLAAHLKIPLESKEGEALTKYIKDVRKKVHRRAYEHFRDQQQQYGYAFINERTGVMVEPLNPIFMEYTTQVSE